MKKRSTWSRWWPALVVGFVGTFFGNAVWHAKHAHDLWAELHPVTVQNCEFARFGEPNDGGYLLCANLLTADVVAGYSYGINGYDGWGCAVATALEAPVHQYDCFNTSVPACPARTVFHAECVGPREEKVDGRPFARVDTQIRTNGDAGRRVVVKMDVEGAEWDALLAMDDDTLDRIDQFVLELHGLGERRHLEAVRRLKRHFLVANLHMNNVACGKGAPPFPASVYEVLFVNKRLGIQGSPRETPFHALDRPNAPDRADCQPST